jgi:hypothetical protein
MGLFPNRWKSCTSSPYAVQDSNPDPSNFKIIDERMVGKYLVLLVSYPNCKNFEGKKLMVYENFTSSKELIKFNSGKLDPHFANRKGSPIARFAPASESLILIERMAGV